MDATEAAPTTTKERIDAIEQFLAQLVLLLEVEPELCRESISAWLQVCAVSTRACGPAAPRRTAALDQLCTRVLGSPAGMLLPSGA
jgi:hypothetical protein